jgi:hypothetical protein
VGGPRRIPDRRRTPVPPSRNSLAETEGSLRLGSLTPVHQPEKEPGHAIVVGDRFYVLTVVTLTAITVVSANIVVDIGYSILGPRVRLP